MQCDSFDHDGRGRVLDVRRGSGGFPSSSDAVVRTQGTLVIRCAARIGEPYPLIRSQSSLGCAGGLKCRADVLAAMDLLPDVHGDLSDETTLVFQEAILPIGYCWPTTTMRMCMRYLEPMGAFLTKFGGATKRWDASLQTARQGKDDDALLSYRRCRVTSIAPYAANCEPRTPATAPIAPRRQKVTFFSAKFSRKHRRDTLNVLYIVSPRFMRGKTDQLLRGYGDTRSALSCLTQRRPLRDPGPVTVLYRVMLHITCHDLRRADVGQWPRL